MYSFFFVISLMDYTLYKDKVLSSSSSLITRLIMHQATNSTIPQPPHTHLQIPGKLNNRGGVIAV